MEMPNAPNDPLEVEIASKSMEIDKARTAIEDASSHLKILKQHAEYLSVEVRALRRAAKLRPSSGRPAARAAAPPLEVAPARPAPVPAPAPVMRREAPPAEMPAAIQAPKADPIWSELVTEGAKKPIRTLGLKFLLTRFTRDAQRDSSKEAVAKRVDELQNFFAKNERLVKEDAAVLFGQKLGTAR